MTDTRHASKTKLLDAALQVIRAKGYTATRIEDICEVANLTKGSFFHHFKSKEDLALAAAEHWGVMTGGLFASAPYHLPADPLDRILAYVDFRKAILQGKLPEFTCLVGTMVQEVYDTHPAIRQACDRSISEHAATLESDIREAMQKYDVDPEWSAESLALYIQAVIQGAFILAKAKGGPDIAASCLDHLRRYIEMLFTQPKAQGETIMSTAGMKLHTYLNYGGNCEQAFRFYEKNLGGKLTFKMTYGEMPDKKNIPPGQEKAILHARLDLGETYLMGADVPPERFQPMRSAYLTLNVSSSEEAERIHALLADGGEIFMPMQETFFAFRFSMLRDKFGTSWMIIHERPMP